MMHQPSTFYNADTEVLEAFPVLKNLASRRTFKLKCPLRYKTLQRTQFGTLYELLVYSPIRRKWVKTCKTLYVSV